MPDSGNSRASHQAAADGGEVDSKQSTESFSQFLGKVFDQLSLSSWMPAAMLVGNAAVLIQVNSQSRLDLGAAIIALTDKPFGIIVVLLFSVVLAAILTQAFQFEAIRLLEGYWSPGFIRSAVTRISVRRHARRLRRLRERWASQLIRCSGYARDRMIETLPDIENAIELQHTLNANISITQKVQKLQDMDRDFSWSIYSPADEMRRLEALQGRIEGYPREDRILPTRLGNALRAHEDRLSDLGGDLRGYILRRFDLIPETLMSQHDQFRTRLDMYCSLVVVFVLLSASGSVLLFPLDGPYHVESIGAALIYALLAVMSYGAAITSARGYGEILVVINQSLNYSEQLEGRNESSE